MAKRVRHSIHSFTTAAPQAGQPSPSLSLPDIAANILGCICDVSMALEHCLVMMMLCVGHSRRSSGGSTTAVDE
eukprot:scaffold34606_cov192-Amphora_coffeaeformis.AAC.14